MGLRERKKEQTRQLLTDTAWQLIADRGFDRVTIAEVALVAGVAEGTVYNYFPTKEDLFYSRLELYGERLVQAVADRPTGEPALAAVSRFLLESEGLLSQAERDPEAIRRLKTMNRVFAESPALRAREQMALASYTEALTEQFIVETSTGSDDAVAAATAANALIGVQRAMIDYVRMRVLNEDFNNLAADVQRLTRDAFALLESGLGSYGSGKDDQHH